MSQTSSAPPGYFSEEPRAATIRDDAEAVAVARDLAATFAAEAAVRDRERRLPWKEVDAFSRSGLWTITVPKAYGGPQVSFATLAEVIATVSAVDPSLGQIPQNHFGIIDVIEQSATEAEKRFWYGEVLRGKRFGNAFSERGTRDILETTASGTVVATDVRVASRHLIASHRAFDRPTRTGPVAQIIQAAVDAGIARGAIADTLAFVRQRSRPWPDSGD